MMERLFEFFLGFDGQTSYLIVFACLMACGLGVPLPEDLTLIGGGLLAYYGKADPYWMVVVSMVGIMLGDSFIFFLGYKYGDRIRRYWPFRKILSDENFEKAKQRFQTKGNKIIFAGRFMPGLRAPIFFTAGSLKLPFRVFFFYDGFAAIISAPAIVLSVYFFGGQLNKVIRLIKNVEHGIVAVIVLVVIFLIAKQQWKNVKLLNRFKAYGKTKQSIS